MFESVLRLVKSCVFRPLDRRQASGHTLRCVRYEPTVIYNLKRVRVSLVLLYMYNRAELATFSRFENTGGSRTHRAYFVM